MTPIEEAWAERDLAALDAALASRWREVPDPFLATLLREVGHAAAARLDAAELARSGPPEVPPGAFVVPLLEPWVRRGGRRTGEAVARRVDVIGETFERDPRIADLAVSLLRDCPAPRSIALDRALWRLLEEQRDPESLQAVRAIPDRGETRWQVDADAEHWRQGRLVRDGIGTTFNQRIQELLALGDRPEWRAARVEPAENRRLQRLRRAFRSEQRFGPAGRAGLEMLRQIAADPKNDALRMVYADHLTQAGDPRGEFVLLQLAQAEGRLPAGQGKRVRELLETHQKEWTRGVAPAIRPRRSDFERGVLTRVRIVKSDLKTQRAVLGAPEWTTVEEVDLASSAHHVVLLDDAFRALRRIRGLGSLDEASVVGGFHPVLHELTFFPSSTGGEPPDTASGFRRLGTLDVPQQLRHALGWLTAGLGRPARIVRVTWNIETEPSSVRQAALDAVSWMAVWRSRVSRRAEAVLAPAGTRPSVIQARDRDGTGELAADLAGPPLLQRLVLSALPTGEVRVIRTDSDEVRTIAAEQFPRARIR